MKLLYKFTEVCACVCVYAGEVNFDQLWKRFMLLPLLLTCFHKEDSKLSKYSLPKS